MILVQSHIVTSSEEGLMKEQQASGHDDVDMTADQIVVLHRHQVHLRCASVVGMISRAQLSHRIRSHLQ